MSTRSGHWQLWLRPVHLTSLLRNEWQLQQGLLGWRWRQSRMGSHWQRWQSPLRNRWRWWQSPLQQVHLSGL